MNFKLKQSYSVLEWERRAHPRIVWCPSYVSANKALQACLKVYIPFFKGLAPPRLRPENNLKYANGYTEFHSLSFQCLRSRIFHIFNSNVYTLIDHTPFLLEQIFF